MAGIYFENQKFEKEEQELKDRGFKYLGWQVHRGNSEELERCCGMKHKDKYVHEKSYSSRGAHNLHWCDECKIMWNIDCGD